MSSPDLPKPKIILRTPINHPKSACLSHDVQVPTPDTSRSIFKTVKDNIRNLIRNDDPVQAQITEQKINDAVYRVHQIVVHRDLFIETLLIYCFEHRLTLPTINDKL